MAVPSYSREQSVFNAGLRECYERALGFNEAGFYDEAYREIRAADMMMTSLMKQASIDAADLGRRDFVRMYFPLKMSLGEIAYKLGLHSEMDSVSAELSGLMGLDVADGYMKARIHKLRGGAHYLKGEYEAAEKELRTADGLWTFDTEFTGVLQLELAQLYYAQRKYEMALACIDKVLHMMKNPVSQADRLNFSGSDLKDVISHRALCLAQLKRWDEAVEEIDAAFVKDDAEWLRRKAKVQMLKYEGGEEYDPQAARLYSDYLSLAKSYVDANFLSMTASQREQYWMSEKSFVTDSYRLEDKAPELLYDVALFSKAVLLQLGRTFREDMNREQKEKALAAVRVGWKTVQKNIPESSAALEYVVYERNGIENLGVLLMDRKNAPKFFRIAPVPEISSMYLLEGEYRSELPELLWNKEILKALEGCSDVYFAPDGILHRLPIEYIVPESISEVNFHRLTSTRQLAEPSRLSGMGNMLVCGGVDYGYAAGSDENMGNDGQAYSVFAGRNMGLRYLAESRREAEGIAGIRSCAGDTLLLGNKASETAVRGLMGEYDIVHIATHGCFENETSSRDDFIPMASDRQLSGSCVFLAGAQSNMNDENFDSSVPDGILSARELAGMKLDNVALVSLSACQSGLGYVTSDGVFGLQRGLKAAGAGALVVSLWDVDDMAASVFFRRLYGNLEAGQSLQKAFSEARKYLMEAQVSVKRRRPGLHDIVRTVSFDDEKYYNAFILIDGI